MQRKVMYEPILNIGRITMPLPIVPLEQFLSLSTDEQVEKLKQWKMDYTSKGHSGCLGIQAFGPVLYASQEAANIREGR